jgi:hypothetical protein
MRGIATSVLVNAILPYIIYQLLTGHISEVLALFASGVPSIIDSIVGIVRKKRIDVLAAIVLIGIAVSLVVVWLGGSPRVYLLRESFFTVAFGLTFLITLLLPRPLIFYLARQMTTGNHPENIPWFNSLWQQPGFRHAMRVMTLVWGIGLLLEAAVRIYLVIILTSAQFLLISPFVIYGIIGCLALWTFLYSRKGRQRAQETMKRMAEQRQAAQQNPTQDAP